MPPLTYSLTASAYPVYQSGSASGTAQASGSTPVTLVNGTTVESSVTMDSTIASVTFNLASVEVGLAESFLATAYDATGAVVLTAPDKWQWSVTNATISSVGASATITGLATGTSTVTATEQESGMQGVLQAQVLPAQIPYTSFNNFGLMLTPWQGHNVAFLTGDPGLDPAVMSKILSTFDSAYAYYQSATGQSPTIFRNYNGIDSIAEVPNADISAGALSYLGATGTEIQQTYFDLLYTQVRDANLWDQVLFYELGRTFWFYGNQIEYKGTDDTGTVATGFAVFMRFASMDAVGVNGAPYNGSSIVDFATLKAADEGLIDQYINDPTLTFANTFEIGKAPPNSLGLGGADLFASMCMRLEQNYGGSAFIPKLWQAVGQQPAASTTTDALNNFVHAASTAAGTDLTSYFRTTLK